MKNDKKKKGLVPKLRFPEFRGADEWKVDILKNVSPAIYDGTHQTPAYVESGIPFFSVENIVSGNKNKFISREDYLVATSKNKPEKGDILITRIGNIGFSVVVDWDYEFSIYVTLAIIKKSTLFNFYYLNSYFQSGRYQNELRSKSLLNAVPCKINMEELRKTEVLLPPLKNEQQKIADCLTSLDELITAEAGKLVAYKTHKKGLMQKLFPAEGETLPEWRFPEFRDKGEWDVEELSEKTDKVGSGITPKGGDKNYKTSGRPFVRSQNVGWGYLILNDVAYIDENTHASFLATEIAKDDVLLNITGASIGRSAVADHHIAGGNVNQHVCIIRTKTKKLNPIFLNQFILSDCGQNQIDSFQAGGNRQGLNFAQIRSFLIPIPPNIEEQKKIADCLSCLDKLITAQAQKIEALKAHKKGLMQGLFPSTDEVGV